MQSAIRATQARIHCRSLKENINSIRQAIPQGTVICAAVKANAYGHGAQQVSKILRNEGVEVLGVSSPAEGMELRNGGDSGRILVLGPAVPDETAYIIEYGLETMVGSASYLKVLENDLLCRPLAYNLPIHLKIDTGMGRIGCRPDEALPLARRIAGNPRLELAGLATHFPSADSNTDEDLAFTSEQIRLLSAKAEEIRQAGIRPGLIHAANSGGIALSPASVFQMVRPGIAVYGYGKNIGRGKLKPVMEFCTRISAIKKVYPGETISYGRTWKADRETHIATLPVGYADGYRRGLSNKSEVLIGNRSYPLAGTVCMDQMMIDLGPECNVKLYDEVVLFGPQSGAPDAEDLGRLSGTISYEIICGITARVPRIYLDI